MIGVAMGSGLYEAAFSAVVHLYGQKARPVITEITLFAGFASTVGWPLSGYLEGLYGWEAVCIVWAALHMVLGFLFTIFHGLGSGILTIVIGTLPLKVWTAQFLGRGLWLTPRVVDGSS